MTSTVGTCYLSGVRFDPDEDEPPCTVARPGDGTRGDKMSTARIEFACHLDDQEELAAKVIYSSEYSFGLVFNDEICSGMIYDTTNETEKVTINLLGLTEFFDLKSIIITDKNVIAILKRFTQRRQTLRKLTINPKDFYAKEKLRSNNEVVFESFARQELAFRYFDEKLLGQAPSHIQNPLKLFAFESLVTGKRQFLVADISTFMTRYLSLEGPKRHVYELIRQDFPCRLYFDLEFSIPANPDVVGQNLIDRWIHIVTWKLYEIYGLTIGSDSFIDLDSSSDVKFSHHLTVIISENEMESTSKMNKRAKVNHSDDGLPTLHTRKEWLFRSNVEMGLFVDIIVREALLLDGVDLHKNPPEVSSDAIGSTTFSTPPLQLPRAHYNKVMNPTNDILFVWNSEKSAKTCFVDLGVYTRNRVFRLLSSCKYGKTSRLRVAAISGAVSGVGASRVGVNHLIKRGNSGARISHHELFSQILYRTFVVPVQVMTTHYSLSKNLKDLRDDHSLRIDILPAVDDIINSTFSRSLGLRRTDTGFRSDEKLNISGTPTKFLSCKDSTSSLSIQNLATSQNSFPIMPSPFPMVDQYVVSSLACRGGVTGRISQWLLKIISSTTTTHTTPTQMPNTIFPQNKSIVMDTHKKNQRAVNSTVFMEYQIAGNRYCQNINRPHKSNNIMFEVNLNSGVARQKCWDIECRGYRSEPILLPLENCPSLLEINETVGDIIIKNALLKDPTCF